MDKYICLLLLEFGLPTLLNMLCLIFLLYRIVRILNAGLLYNRAMPIRLVVKMSFLFAWIVLCGLQAGLMNVKNERNKYYWMK